MITVTVDKLEANLAKLDEELRAILGAVRVYGSGYGDGKVRAYVTDDLTEEERATVIAAMTAHDPNALTPAQEAEQANRVALQDARRTIAALNIDLTDYAGDLPRIRLLAAKIKWIEYELRNLVRELREGSQ